MGRIAINRHDAAMTPILYHYEASPYAELVRAAFGVKGLAWGSLIIPRILPKPDQTQLTGAYGRTPVVQIGADIYCDTGAILPALESLEKLYQANPQNIQLLEELSKMKTQIGTLHFEQQRFAEAAGPLKDASTLRRMLVELKPRDIVAGQLLANSEMNLGLLEESLGHSQKALEQYQAAQRRHTSR